MKKLAILILLLSSGNLQAHPDDSVVRILSHGGSGTCIATGDGWTIILSAAHMFEGRDRNKAIVLDMKHPMPKRGEIKLPMPARVLAVGRTEINDVAVFQINVGPVAYVSPVAPLGYRPDSDCLSIGFDELKFPPHCRPAKITSTRGNATFTDARPWHGRSGGALIEKKSGYLIGVVSAYSGPKNHAEFHPGANGVYASLTCVQSILMTAGVTPRAQVPENPQSPPQGPPQEPFQQKQWGGPQDCPGGNCPTPQGGGGRR